MDLKQETLPSMHLDPVPPKDERYLFIMKRFFFSLSFRCGFFVCFVFKILLTACSQIHRAMET